MRYTIKPGQVSYGEAVGILLLENFAPFIPGDTANATTYRYPVRFERVPGLSVERIFRHDRSLYPAVRDAARALKREGVRAVTGDCGFMAVYQRELAEELGLPVFLSSLLQIPFISLIIGREDSIGVITADSQALSSELLSWAGVNGELQGRLRIAGLEGSPHFRKAVIEEQGVLDTEGVEAEVVQQAVRLQKEHPGMKAVLLECSMLPPYGAAVQAALGLPVFDYVTMLDYVWSAVVKRTFEGYM
jgi:Asp/Glu/hydantoin racemase